MTLSRFEYLLKKIDPRLCVRQSRLPDVAGLFVGMSGKTGYICRLTQGELNLHGYRMQYTDPKDISKKSLSVIKKRGRVSVVKLLRKYRWITKPEQETMLMYGIEYPDHVVRGDFVGGGSNA